MIIFIQNLQPMTLSEITSLLSLSMYTIGCWTEISDTRGGSRRVAKFLQKSILIAFDFIRKVLLSYRNFDPSRSVSGYMDTVKALLWDHVWLQNSLTVLFLQISIYFEQNFFSNLRDCIFSFFKLIYITFYSLLVFRVNQWILSKCQCCPLL